MKTDLCRDDPWTTAMEPAMEPALGNSHGASRVRDVEMSVPCLLLLSGKTMCLHSEHMFVKMIRHILFFDEH